MNTSASQNETKPEQQVWLITGASRGLGRALTHEVLNQGHIVVAGVRDPASVEPFETQTGHLELVELDVTSETQPAEAVRLAVERFGRLDTVVNNAGAGLVGAVEETSPAETAGLMDLNLLGPLRLIRAALPVMRARSAGTVVNISSLGGFAGSPGNGAYGATKFALEGLSEALAAEVGPLGIRVLVVEPGFFRTDFLSGESIRHAEVTIEEYDPIINRGVTRMDGQQPGDPAKAATAIVDAVMAEAPPFRLPLGHDALERVETKQRRVSEELETWRTLSMSTGFPTASHD